MPTSKKADKPQKTQTTSTGNLEKITHTPINHVRNHKSRFTYET